MLWVQEDDSVKWEDRVLEYGKERGERRMRGLEQARRECMETILSWPSHGRSSEE